MDFWFYCVPFNIEVFEIYFFPVFIVCQVSDLYKRPNSDSSPVKSLLDEASHGTMARGVQLLGQIKNGSCRPRAILFKVLADTVGLESKLMVVCGVELEIDCLLSSSQLF